MPYLGMGIVAQPLTVGQKDWYTARRAALEPLMGKYYGKDWRYMLGSGFAAIVKKNYFSQLEADWEAKNPYPTRVFTWRGAGVPKPEVPTLAPKLEVPAVVPTAVVTPQPVQAGLGGGSILIGLAVLGFLLFGRGRK